MTEITAAFELEARRLDAEDELAAFREEFFVTAGDIYLDGNSLGLLSRRSEAAVLRVLDEWKTLRVEGWTAASSPWFTLAEALARETASLVGAHADEVITTNSTTVNLHQLIATLYHPEDPRACLLTDELSFPSDRYALESQLRLHGHDPATYLVLVPSSDGLTLDEDDIVAAMSARIQVAVLPAVIYTSGQLLDIERLTRTARDRKILIGFDCSHSIGVLPHHLSEWGVDFAFWCGYKYLNGGPGAAGGIYLNRRHHGSGPGLAGWFSSDKSRQFDMSPHLLPAGTASALQIGTPNILSMAPLQGALEVIAEAGIERVRRKSLALTQLIRNIVTTELGPYAVTVKTPDTDSRRGGHIAVHHREAALICKALRASGVVVDHRPPEIIRLAPSPLYTRFVDCVEAVRGFKAAIVGESYKAFAPDRQLLP